MLFRSKILGKIQLIQSFRQLSHEVPLCVACTLEYAERRMAILCAFVKAAIRPAVEVISSRQYPLVGVYRRAGFLAGVVVVIGCVSFELYGAALNRGKILYDAN